MFWSSIAKDSIWTFGKVISTFGDNECRTKIVWDKVVRER